MMMEALAAMGPPDDWTQIANIGETRGRERVIEILADGSRRVMYSQYVSADGDKVDIYDEIMPPRSKPCRVVFMMCVSGRLVNLTVEFTNVSLWTSVLPGGESPRIFTMIPEMAYTESSIVLRELLRVCVLIITEGVDPAKYTLDSGIAARIGEQRFQQLKELMCHATIMMDGAGGVLKPGSWVVEVKDLLQEQHDTLANLM